MLNETTVVMVTRPEFLMGEIKRHVKDGVIYRMHSNTVPDGEVFWITTTANGVICSSKVWESRATLRRKWNDMLATTA